MTESTPPTTAEETTGINQWIYKLMTLLGLTSGIGLVAWGGWWFIFCMANYLFTDPENVMQQTVVEARFTQAQLSAVVLALGVLIMETKRSRKGDHG